MEKRRNVAGGKKATIKIAKVQRTQQKGLSRQLWFHPRVSDPVLRTVNGGTCLKANMLKKVMIIKIRLTKHVEVVPLLKKHVSLQTTDMAQGWFAPH